MVINYLLLSLTAIVIKNKYSRLRLVLASVLATTGSIFFPFITNIFISNLYKILLALAMILVAFDKLKLSKVLLSMLTLCIFTYGLGGLIYAVGGSIQNGIFAFSIPIPFSVIAIIGILYYSILKLWLKSYNRKKLSRSFIYETTFFYNDKKYSTFAYLDSGNTLTDPEDNTPVVIITPKILFALVDMSLETYVNMSKQKSVLPQSHYIDYKTIHSEQKMLIFKIDKIQLKSKNEFRELKNVSCGISKINFQKNNGCDALLNCKLQEIL